MRDRTRLSFPDAGGIQLGTDRGVRWRSGTRLGALPLMNNFQGRVGRTADAQTKRGSDVKMRVEVSVLESGTEPGVSVQPQPTLMKALRTGSIEVARAVLR